MLPHMNLGTRTALLTAGTAVALLLGIALVLLGDARLATVGIVLVIASAIAFLVDLGDALGETGDRVRE